ncbi:2-methylcitrate dehydratase PrpD [Rhizobium petrolearium]|uniref:MmgE/PrpD family protein n=1 Tax=Neorhizobium petrolearium TaxID=515361 RepID=UPI001AE4555D|nr:MmgE/PrpD family protein [Neorhizobium petrolearium]MBP1846587.1 2-methylcitrate dehydratase PrpD [Neorhizobium petrolearium]
MNARDLVSILSVIDGGDQKLRDLVSLHTVDALACLAAGAGSREGSSLLAFYRETGAGDAVSSAAGASAVIRFTEWDAIHVPSCATPDAMAVPAALSFAQDIPTYVKAVAAGHAIGVALSEAVGGVAALPETWPGLFAAPAVAAVSAAIAMGLSDEQIAQALVLSVAGSSGRNGRPSGMPSARWLVIGEAVLKGIRAALAAKADIKGDLDLLSPCWMKGQAASAVPLEAAHINSAVIAKVVAKPFVSARQGINAIQAFSTLLQKGADPIDIESVQVYLPPVAVPVVSRPLAAEDRLSTIAHLGLQLGIAAFEPARQMDVDRSRAFGTDVLDFAKRVTVSADESLTAEGWPARVVVSEKGQTREAVWPQNFNEDAQAVLDRKIESLQPAVAHALQRIEMAFTGADPSAVAETRGLMRSLTDSPASKSEAA